MQLLHKNITTPAYTDLTELTLSSLPLTFRGVCEFDPFTEAIRQGACQAACAAHERNQKMHQGGKRTSKYIFIFSCTELSQKTFNSK